MRSTDPYLYPLTATNKLGQRSAPKHTDFFVDLFGYRGAMYRRSTCFLRQESVLDKAKRHWNGISLALAENSYGVVEDRSREGDLPLMCLMRPGREQNDFLGISDKGADMIVSIAVNKFPLEEIEPIYFVRGHSKNENGSVHAAVERALKKQSMSRPPLHEHRSREPPGINCTASLRKTPDFRFWGSLTPGQPAHCMVTFDPQCSDPRPLAGLVALTVCARHWIPLRSLRSPDLVSKPHVSGPESIMGHLVDTVLYNSDEYTCSFSVRTPRPSSAENHEETIQSLQRSHSLSSQLHLGVARGTLVPARAAPQITVAACETYSTQCKGINLA
ncbi:hypothetical protein RRG08_032060 [Elysia crispata]|uniref:Uncharacterized protein n=1 Tax=Elysia crispata TaxID=231223 RepID=A0AAE0ZGP3_9GAST|nr:hypothetical protein RRG08_032060 [Elysia crispata]